MLARVVMGSGSLSLLGGLFVMVSASTLFSSKMSLDGVDLQISQIVFCLAITDMIFSVNLVLEGGLTIVKGARWRDEHLPVCSAQGFINQFCMLSIALWNLAIGVSVFRTSISASATTKRPWRWLLLWMAICWLVPLVTAIYGAVRGLYGPSAGWCWMVSKESTNENLVNHWLLMYGPIFAVLTVNAVLYFILARKRCILTRATTFNTNQHQYSSAQTVGPDSAYEPYSSPSLESMPYDAPDDSSDIPLTQLANVPSSPSIDEFGGGDAWVAERRHNYWVVLRLVAFIAVFILSWSGGAVLYVSVLLHAKRTMAMLVCYCISVPLGGFLNAVVYGFLWVKAYRNFSCCRAVQPQGELYQPLRPGLDIIMNRRSMDSASFSRAPNR